MAHLSDLEESAMQLSEKDRAQLATKLLCSLPPILQDDDEGITEALRRSEELDHDPSIGMTMAEFRASFNR